MSLGIIIAMLVIAAVVTIVGLLTGMKLKEKVVERLKKWGVISEAVIDKKRLMRWIQDAEKNGENTHLSVDQLDALDKMGEDELVLADLKKNGKIGKVSRLKGEKGMHQNLRRFMEEHDGMIIMESRMA